MKTNVVSLENKKVGDIELSSEIFGAAVRPDIMARVVRWQLAKRRSGDHKTKTRWEVHGTTKKAYRQKGTGRARHGALTAPQFRKGGVVFGPVVRDHGFSLPKKVRALGLRSALSMKLSEGHLIIVDEAKLKTAKTKELLETVKLFGAGKTLIIDGPVVDNNFKLASSNIHTINILPSVGANVYDILRCQQLVITKAGIEALEERLK